MVISYLSFIPYYLLGQILVIFILLEMIHSTYTTSGMLRKSVTSFHTLPRRSYESWKSFLVSMTLIYKVKPKMNSWEVEFIQRAASGHDICLLKFPVEWGRAFRKSQIQKQSTNYYGCYVQVSYWNPRWVKLHYLSNQLLSMSFHLKIYVTSFSQLIFFRFEIAYFT